MYAFVFWAVWVSGFVTVTVTIPDACEVVVPVIAVGVTDPTVRAEPPKLTFGLKVPLTPPWVIMIVYFLPARMMLPFAIFKVAPATLAPPT